MNLPRISRLLAFRRNPVAADLERRLAERKAARAARREAAEAALSRQWKRRGDAARAYAERIGR